MISDKHHKQKSQTKESWIVRLRWTVAWLYSIPSVQNAQEKTKEKNHLLSSEKIVDEKQIRPNSFEAWILWIRDWWCEAILWTKIQQKHSQQQTACNCYEMTSKRETRTKIKDSWKSIAETSRKTSERIVCATWRLDEMKESSSSIVAETSIKIRECEQVRRLKRHRCVRRWKNLEDVQDRTRWASNDLSKLQYECEQSRVIDWRRKRSTWYVVQLKITKNQKVKRIDRKLNQWTSLRRENATQYLTIYILISKRWTHTNQICKNIDMWEQAHWTMKHHFENLQDRFRKKQIQEEKQKQEKNTRESTQRRKEIADMRRKYLKDTTDTLIVVWYAETKNTCRFITKTKTDATMISRISSKSVLIAISKCTNEKKRETLCQEFITKQNNESRTSNRDVEKKQFVEKQIFWTQLLRFLQVLFSWILHIRHARLFDWDIRRTWRMKECVHWVIQMKCKNNDCTDVRFTMYRIQEKEKYYAIRTDNRQCRRKSDLYCEQFHLRHWLMRKIRAWLLKLILPRICNQMMTEENQAYW